MKKGIASLFAVVLVITIPFGVSALNQQLVGSPVVSVQADNLIKNTSTSYTEPIYIYDNGSGEQTEALGWTVDNDGIFTINTPDVTVDDAVSDRVQLAILALTPRDLIDKSIQNVAVDLETLENYENLLFKIYYEGSSGSTTLFSTENMTGWNYEHVENMTALKAYDIQGSAGDNAKLMVVLKSYSGDNQALNAESLTFEVEGYETETTISMTTKSVWRISMAVMCLFSFMLALIATPWIDITG